MFVMISEPCVANETAFRRMMLMMLLVAYCCFRTLGLQPKRLASVRIAQLVRAPVL